MLAVVRARFAVDWACQEWIEDELVRRGARDAHRVDDGAVSVTLEARSHAEAMTLVQDLLVRLGATDVQCDEQSARRQPTPV